MNKRMLLNLTSAYFYSFSSNALLCIMTNCKCQPDWVAQMFGYVREHVLGKFNI